MPNGGGQTGSKLLLEMSDSHARVLPRSLQQRRAEILKAAPAAEERREEAREEEAEIQRRERLGPALHVLQDHGITGTSAEMKKAFQRFALKNHPDKLVGKPQAEIDQKQALFPEKVTVIVISVDALSVPEPSGVISAPDTNPDQLVI